MSEPVEHTSDGRHIVVNGRRWRATDPNIPESLREELVSELMNARRGVKSARADAEELARVRARVHNAKIALGERGEAWWVEPSDEGRAERATATIMALLSKRGSSSSTCPSEVARVLASPEWQSAMGVVGSAARELAARGSIQVSRSGDVDDERRDASESVRYALPVESDPEREKKERKATRTRIAAPPAT